MNEEKKNEKETDTIFNGVKNIIDDFNKTNEILIPVYKLIDEYNIDSVGSLSFVGKGKDFYEISLINNNSNADPFKTKKEYKDVVPGGYLITSLNYALNKGRQIDWLKANDKNISNLYLDAENKKVDVNIKILNQILTERCKELIYIFNCKFSNRKPVFFGSTSENFIYSAPGIHKFNYIKQGVSYYPFVLHDEDDLFGYSFEALSLKSNSIFSLIYSEFVECIKAGLRLKKCTSCDSLMFTNTQQKYCPYCYYPTETKRETALRKQTERLLSKYQIWTKIEREIKKYMEKRDFTNEEIINQIAALKERFNTANR